MKTHPCTQALVLALCSTLVFPQEPVGNILEVASDPRFSTLANLIEQAGLVDVLSSEGPLTVFAPTDKAFDVVGQDALDALTRNITGLREVLLYHVVADGVYSWNLTDVDVLASTQGQPLRINVFPASLLPVVTVNGAQVIDANMEASNGVIHAIDRVLLIPQGDLTQVLASDGRFSTLVKAVVAAGLLDTLQSEGPFTVFAPTDAAFDLLPSGTLDSLLSDPAALSNVLLRHVVGAAVYYKVFPATMTTANNQTLKINFNIPEADLVVSSSQGEAKLIDLDLTATNGVIHVIDAVI